jgi:WD40 repeat protein
MRFDFMGVCVRLVLLSTALALSTRACFSTDTVDQENNATSNGGVNVASTTKVGQTFVPRLPWLSSIEVKLSANNFFTGTVTLVVTDPRRKKVLASCGKNIGWRPIPLPVKPPFQGFAKCDLPEGGIAVTPGRPLVISLQATGQPNSIRWLYANGNPYPFGSAMINGVASPTRDFLFKTLGTNPPLSKTVEPGHWVNWVSISGDGAKILAGTFVKQTVGNYGVYRLENAANVLWSDSDPNAYAGIATTAVSQNGLYGAAGGWRQGYVGFLRAYDMSTGARLLDDTPEKRVNAVAFSQDGSWLIAVDGSSGSANALLRLYKLQSGTYSLANSYSFGTQSIDIAAVSQDGSLIVTGASAGKVSLFANTQGTLQLKNSFTEPNVPSVEFVDISADGSVFAASFPDGKIAVFKSSNFPSSGQPEWTSQLINSQSSVHPTCNGHSIYAIRVSADGGRVVSSSDCSTDGYVDMFKNPPTLESNLPVPEWSFKLNRPPNPGLSIDGAAKYVAVADGYPVGSPGNFYLFDATTGRNLWNYPSGDENYSIAISNDGKYIVGGSDDGKIYFWKNY